MSSLVQATNARYEFSANDQSLTGGFISIVVGSVESEATFIVHERLICETSEFVKRAMGGEWKESRQRLIRLPDQSPRVFHIYVQWLYLHVLPTRDDSEHSYGEYDQLARAYILGDILLDTSFRDAVIDAMLDKALTLNPGQSTIELIYENTVASCAARRLLVDLYTERARGIWLKTWAPDSPARDFFYDLAVALLDKRQKTERKEWNPCDYHDHGLDENPRCQSRLP